MRSIEIAARILGDVLDYCDRHAITVPLGLNVEHVTSRNFDICGELLERLDTVISIAGRRSTDQDIEKESETALHLATWPTDPPPWP